MPPAAIEEIAVAVLARAPVPGAAKTRLIPRLGPQGAARLHAALVAHALGTVRDAGLGPATLWGAPDAGHPFFQACRARFGVALADQPAGDLGARMRAAVAARAPALLIGTDCPALRPAHLRAAARALVEGLDAVLAPAEDGGYALIGLAKPVAAPFEEVAWGTGTVMAETRGQLARAGLRWAEIETLWDVDRPEDVDRLAASGLLAAWRE